MVIRILGNNDTEAYRLAKNLVISLGHSVDDGTYFYVDLAIAPLLTTRVSESELNEPRLGTLIFHPSPLPYGRVASSIRWVYNRKEPISGATWFWANAGKIDGGDICEQEIIRINYDLSPREFYIFDMLPAMLRTLRRALVDIDVGVIRRVVQLDEYSSFDYSIKKVQK